MEAQDRMARLTTDPGLEVSTQAILHSRVRASTPAGLAPELPPARAALLPPASPAHCLLVILG
jgi:hypothetical protein